MISGGDRLSMARDAKSAGRAVVGMIGATVPVELVVAAGAFPVTLGARAEDFERQSPFMEPQHDAELRSLFWQAINGDYAFCDLILIAGTSDSYRYLFQYLEEMRRRGWLLPNIVLCDWLYGDSSALAQYDRGILERICASLGSISRTEQLIEGLPDAIAAVNSFRALYRDLSERRSRGMVLGSQFMAALSLGLASDRTRGYPVLSMQGGFDHCPPILAISAVPLYHTTLHLLVESVGGNIVDEDDEWGSRRITANVSSDGPPLNSIQDYYLTHAPSPRMPTRIRESWVTARLRAGRLSGVVFYIPHSDSYFGWRYPALRDLAAAGSIPSLLIAEEVLDGSTHDALRSRLSQFVQSLSRPGSPE